MDDLLAFVRAQLDADDRVATGLIDRWHRGEWASDSVYVTEGGAVCGTGQNPPIAKHIARWDPARVLAEVEAKRQLLAVHAESDFPYDPENAPGGYSWTAQCQGCYEDEPCRTVRLLAQPYADRPGFRDEWRA